MTEWIVMKALPDSVMVAVAGTEKSAKYVREGSSDAEKTLERTRDVLFDALEVLKRCKTRRCKSGEYQRIEEAAYYVGVELYDDLEGDA